MPVDASMGNQTYTITMHAHYPSVSSLYPNVTSVPYIPYSTSYDLTLTDDETIVCDDDDLDI